MAIINALGQRFQLVLEGLRVDKHWLQQNGSPHQPDVAEHSESTKFLQMGVAIESAWDATVKGVYSLFKSIQLCVLVRIVASASKYRTTFQVSY
jgi:hypothetical protein